MRVKYYIVDADTNKFVKGYYKFHINCTEDLKELKEKNPNKNFKILWIYA